MSVNRISIKLTQNLHVVFASFYSKYTEKERTFGLKSLEKKYGTSDSVRET